MPRDERRRRERRDDRHDGKHDGQLDKREARGKTARHLHPSSIEWNQRSI